VADEPDDNSAADFRILASIIRRFMPGVKLMDAIMYTGMPGALDIMVPTNNYYEQNRDAFEAMRATGTTMWFYTCVNPGGKYCNRFLDIPLIKTRYLHWGNYKYDLGGYLHWGYNFTERIHDPFKMSCPVHGNPANNFMLPPGDCNIVYPGPGRPWMSLRLESMRMGLEDLDLLRMVEQKDKAKADALCAEVFTKFDDVVLDVDAFEKNQIALLEAASAK